ncbi:MULTISPECIES: hypothetical protein [unclassified Nocardia]|uniref:hypothetical protein n=1 Tax=unclassified Nocardia TaxID=2637762 RepID=UPI001CE41690|nr:MULTISPECIES: hypothetical protein [unclassified Nocardia]
MPIAEQHPLSTSARTALPQPDSADEPIRWPDPSPLARWWQQVMSPDTEPTPAATSA